MVFFRHNDLKASKRPVEMPINIPKAAPLGSKRLLLSDNPETLDETTFPMQECVLWHDRVCTYQNKTTIRVYGWHVNNTKAHLKLAITLENLNNKTALEIKNVKHEAKTTLSDSFYITGVGKPLAYACLASDMRRINLMNKRVTPEKTVKIQEYDIKKGALLGFILEFEIDGECEGQLDYKIRVVASKNNKTDLCSIKDGLALSDKVHYRGSWAQADIYAKVPPVHVGETFSYSISNGMTDNLQTALTSYDSDNATDNPGHYGCIYRIQIPIINNQSNTRSILIGVNPRGGDYAGAVKLPAATLGIPLLKVNEENFANVMLYRACPGLSYAELAFMHAGAATMPLAVYITTL